MSVSSFLKKSSFAGARQAVGDFAMRNRVPLAIGAGAAALGATGLGVANAASNRRREAQRASEMQEQLLLMQMYPDLFDTPALGGPAEMGLTSNHGEEPFSSGIKQSNYTPQYDRGGGFIPTVASAAALGGLGAVGGGIHGAIRQAQYQPASMGNYGVPRKDLAQRTYLDGAQDVQRRIMKHFTPGADGAVDLRAGLRATGSDLLKRWPRNGMAIGGTAAALGSLLG